jgi:glutamate-1-semialdehyde 2,1-aminomutase
MAIMPDTTLTNSVIEGEYRARTPRSAKLAAEAAGLFPGGIVHDSRYLKPHGPYVERAAGARKWDVDGNEYVDYAGGHGALLLGHNHPEVARAIADALARGTHFGANHPYEMQWAQAVKRLVPSAERVRFTSSGTEATHMALRLARAFTGRRKVIRFLGHFHGWHDHMTSGYTNHFDGSATPGVLSEVAASSLLLAPQLDVVKAALEADDDIAAVILEPTGATFGHVPLPPGFQAGLRELTAKHGVVLAFDEVVTGFRVSPGGAQAHYGIKPDLSTFAKILAGGLPGGAVVGRAEILDQIDADKAKESGREKIQHQGTYNANPVSAVAGAAALKIVETTDACARANASAEALRGRLNDALAAAGVPWAAYGEFSGVHIFTNPKGRKVDPRAFDPRAVDWTELKGSRAEAVRKLRLALLTQGVDFNGWPGGVLSSAHGPAELDFTVAAFVEALARLKREGEL